MTIICNLKAPLLGVPALSISRSSRPLLLNKEISHQCYFPLMNSLWVSWSFSCLGQYDSPRWRRNVWDPRTYQWGQTASLWKKLTWSLHCHVSTHHTEMTQLYWSFLHALYSQVYVNLMHCAKRWWSLKFHVTWRQRPPLDCDILKCQYSWVISVRCGP